MIMKNLILGLVGLAFLCAVVMAESKLDVDKVKILIPHKIGYVHHHQRSNLKGLLRKKKSNFYETRLKTRDVYVRDEDEEDDDDEDDDEDDGDDDRDRDRDVEGDAENDESDEEVGAATKKKIFYAIPAAKLSRNGNDISLKPVLLYKSDRSRETKRHSKREKFSESAPEPVIYGGFRSPRDHRNHVMRSLTSQRHFWPHFQKREKRYKYNFRI